MLLEILGTVIDLLIPCPTEVQTIEYQWSSIQRLTKTGRWRVRVSALPSGFLLILPNFVADDLHLSLVVHFS